MNARALFTGRFQPPSVAHAAMVETILERWRDVTVGVVDLALTRSAPIDARWRPHIEATRAGFTPMTSPFTSAEVVQMWGAWIDAHDLNGRVSAMAIPRVYDPRFATMFPKCDYDLVYPTRESSDVAERVRAELFGTLLDRPIFFERPPFQLHNSEIKQLVSVGRSWREFVAPGAYELFASFDGSARLERATASKK